MPCYSRVEHTKGNQEVQAREEHFSDFGLVISEGFLFDITVYLLLEISVNYSSKISQIEMYANEFSSEYL